MTHKPVFSKDDYNRMLDEKLTPPDVANTRPLLDKMLEAARRVKKPGNNGNQLKA